MVVVKLSSKIMTYRFIFLLFCLFSAFAHGDYVFCTQQQENGVSLCGCSTYSGGSCTEIMIPDTYNGQKVVGVYHGPNYPTWSVNNVLTSVTVAPSVHLHPSFLGNSVPTTYFFLGDRDKLGMMFANSSTITAILYCPGRDGWPGDDYDGLTPQPNLTCDSDDDGVVNVDDSFPFDSTETVDTDEDGIGNNADNDDDNDGFLDEDDFDPLDNTVGDVPYFSVFDIDQNGSFEALTDALILLRYAFGLRGDNLINGAIATDANRTSAEDIEAHIQSHLP
jgi:hypothetical protein